MFNTFRCFIMGLGPDDPFRLLLMERSCSILLKFLLHVKATKLLFPIGHVDRLGVDEVLVHLVRVRPLTLLLGVIVEAELGGEAVVLPLVAPLLRRADALIRLLVVAHRGVPNFIVPCIFIHLLIPHETVFIPLPQAAIQARIFVPLHL